MRAVHILILSCLILCILLWEEQTIYDNASFLELNVKRLKKINNHGASVGPVFRIIIVQYDCRTPPPNLLFNFVHFVVLFLEIKFERLPIISLQEYSV